MKKIVVFKYISVFENVLSVGSFEEYVLLISVRVFVFIMFVN